jgi:hypothetical protein
MSADTHGAVCALGCAHGQDRDSDADAYGRAARTVGGRAQGRGAPVPCDECGTARRGGRRGVRAALFRLRLSAERTKVPGRVHQPRRVLQTVYALSALAQRDRHALPAYLAPLTPEQALELAAAGRAPGNPAVATVSVPVPVPETASAQMHDEGVPAAAAVASAAAPVQEPAATAKPGKGTAPRKAPKPSAGKPVAVSASAGAEAGEPQPATPTQVRASSVEAVQRYMADAVVPKVEHIEYLARGSAFKARVAQTETECV